MTRAVHHATLLLLALVWAAPLYFVVVTAATGSADFDGGGLWGWPQPAAFVDNLAAAWRAADLGPSVASSLLYGVGGAAIGVMLAALAAFGIVVLRIRFGFTWFMLLYAGTIFPLQMYLSPLYTMYLRTGLYDTRLGLVLLYTAIAIPFAVFVLRNHFASIPGELREAAQVDGASPWATFRSIYLPLSPTALAAMFIFQFTWIWNDLLFGLTLSRSGDVRPIMTALAALQGQYASASVPVVLAGGLTVALPTAVLFLAVQRLFATGITMHADR